MCTKTKLKGVIMILVIMAKFKLAVMAQRVNRYNENFRLCKNC